MGYMGDPLSNKKKDRKRRRKHKRGERENEEDTDKEEGRNKFIICVRLGRWLRA